MKLSGVGSVAFSTAVNQYLDLESLLADARDTAQYYIDKDSVITGSSANVTSITTDGEFAEVFTPVGTGDPITQTTTGFTFTGGQYLRCNDVSGTYDEALIIIEATFNGDPSSSAGEIFTLDKTSDERAYVRYTSTRVQYLIPTTTVSCRNETYEAGVRKVMALHLNYVTGLVRAYDLDGYEITNEIDPASISNLVLAQSEMGKACNVTIHRLAVWLKNDSVGSEEDPEFWFNNYSEKKIPNIDKSGFEYHPWIGQSEALGLNVDPDIRVQYEVDYRFQTKKMYGLIRSDAADVHIHGSGAFNIDYTSAATSIGDIDVASNVPMSFSAAISEHKVRDSLGLTSYAHLIQSTCIAGQSIVEFDDNNPLVTGTASIASHDNYDYILSEFKRLCLVQSKTAYLPTLTIYQGTADHSMVSGEWLINASESVDDWIDVAISNGFTEPTLMVYQVAGTNNTTGEEWYCKNDQIQLAINYDGVLVGPMFTYPVYDGVHPTLDAQNSMGKLWAWARAENEKGNDWNLIPTATLSGSTVTVSVSTRNDESLVIDGILYNGGDVYDSFLGFESVGSNITNVTVNSDNVVIECDGAPTAIKYALQQRDNSGDMFINTYSSHRGKIRTSLTKTIDGETMYRFLPSFVKEFD